MGEDVVFKRREEISVGETGRKKEKGEEKYEGKNAGRSEHVVISKDRRVIENRKIRCRC